MKRVILLALALSACAPDRDMASTGPKVPDLPANLAIKANPLPPIPDTTMGTAHIQGAKDDMRYNDVRDQLNDLIDLYNCVKLKINEGKECK